MDNQKFYDIMTLLDEYAFYHTGHAIIYRSIKDLFVKNTAVDIVTLTESLSTHGKLDAIGGAFYLTTLVENVLSTSNIIHHATIVKDKYIARRFIQAAGQIAQNALDQEINIDTLNRQSLQSIFDIVSTCDTSQIESIFDILVQKKGVMESIEHAYAHKGELTGIPSGYYKLDNMTAGFQNSDLIIIAARPSIGKSSLAHNMLFNMGNKQFPVLLFSLEMSKHQVAYRILCTDAQISSEKVRMGYINQNNMEQLFESANKISAMPINVDDTPAISVMELCGKARRMKMKFPNLAAIIIDYFGLMTGSSKAENHQEEMRQISGNLKKLARELHLPVILIGQLNREIEKRGDKSRPKLSDLKETGALEQDADVIIFLHHPPPAATGPLTGMDDIVEIIVAKQRNGPTGIIPMRFNKNITQFTELELSSGYQPPSDIPNSEVE